MDKSHAARHSDRPGASASPLVICGHLPGESRTAVSDAARGMNLFLSSHPFDQWMNEINYATQPMLLVRRWRDADGLLTSSVTILRDCFHNGVQRFFETDSSMASEKNGSS